MASIASSAAVRARRLGFLIVALAPGDAPRLGAQAALPDPVATAITRALGAAPGRLRTTRPREATALRALYGGRDPVPLWTLDHHPTAQARAAIRVLSAVRDRGLEPGDYAAAPLQALADSLDTGAGGRAVMAGRFDVELSRALVGLLADLHLGRASPGTLGFDLPDAHHDLDLAALLRSVSSALDVDAAIRAAEPPYAGYVALERALIRYHALAADSTLLRPRLPRTTLRPGSPGDSAALASLGTFLAAVGDLPAAGPLIRDSLGDPLYAGPLPDGVRAFQTRHGLAADGVVGPATRAALRVPLAVRARQIELALERWRWLPDRPPPRYVVVNIPAFRLYAFEDDSLARTPAMAMDVIVGEAGHGRRTPVFWGTMREVVLNPYWDVPPKIARTELIPLERRAPGSLARDSFEIVRGGDDDAVVYPLTWGNLARVGAGGARLRQRPGGTNALGPLKFVFPNRNNVYLHGTPATSLFAYTRRDFSHGCIRIEDPVGLATLVLRAQPEWNRAAIEAGIATGLTKRVAVLRPVTVFVLYATVVARDERTVHFYPDLYGHDAALARALDDRR